ncbi:MAG: glycerol-3-phosphate 1-O-acyltransferase PlsY [Armatimonadota bacterium]
MSLLLILGSYLIGAIPFGVLIVRAATGQDIRSEGSGNIGASNVFRVAGPLLAAAVLLLDLLKGLVPVLAARRLGFDPAMAVAAGIAAIAGHNWSVFLGWKGGKGIATSYGALLALSPVAGAIAAAIWIVVAVLTRYASLASLLGMLSVPFVMWTAREPVAHLTFGVAAVVFAFHRHRANIGRLTRGEELRLGRPKG